LHQEKQPYLNTVMNQNQGCNVAYWVAEFQKGNSHAFSVLYDLHVNVLYNYGCKLTNDKELLKDCIHDVFVKIYTKRAELDTIENFKSYLFISLKNKLCDEMRKRIYVSDASVEEIEPIASNDDVESRYMLIERDQLQHSFLERIMCSLSPRQREALTLYYIEERKYEDICTIMDLNYQSVRNLMHRGLTKLRSLTR
jgi:RNA polymerase sigma factor (sigma-70 family)